MWDSRAEVERWRRQAAKDLAFARVYRYAAAWISYSSA